jgi:3-deoxy-D-manno-octulosonate 8-phosphate phosphatase (KDO 8-P phosphatase)
MSGFAVLSSWFFVLVVESYVAFALPLKIEVTQRQRTRDTKTMNDAVEIERRAKQIKLLLMDCDGVLTDGSLTLLDDGDELKSFNVRDGHGIVLLHRAGLRSGILSGRRSTSVERRAQELGMHMELVCQGSLDKIKDFGDLLARAELQQNEVAYIGDDVNDIPVMQRVELAVAVADATAETLSAAHYVTKGRGGRGAVREVVELILKAQGQWNKLMERYLHT